MKYTPYLLIFIIFLLLVHLKYQNKLENYSSESTHSLYNGKSVTNSYQLTNYILDKNTNVKETNDNWKKNGFYHLYDKFGRLHFPERAYTDNVMPTLILESTAKCPILFSLFNSLERLDRKFTTNEKIEGMDFRNKIQSTFFNIDETVLMDFPIINLKSSLVETTPTVETIHYQPNFYFGIKNIDLQTDFDSFKNTTPIPTPPNFVKYIDNLPNNDNQKHYQFNHKQATFNVREDYTIPDILRYLDFCYTTLCWGALNIRLMKPLDNHYYGFPCQNENCNTSKNYFYLLPVRVRQICYEEGKEYTRAKCNNCASCVVVYFDTLPEKFINLNQNISITSTFPPFFSSS